MMDGMILEIIKRWMVVMVYVTCLFTLSSLPGKTFQDVPHFEGMDKVVHAGLYGGLGFLLASRVSVPVALLVSVGVGAAEENYQRLTPCRECSKYDWLADVLGAALGIAFCRAFFKRRG